MPESRCKTASARAPLLAQMLTVLGLPFHGNLIDLRSRHRMAPHWADCSQHNLLALLWIACVSLIIWFRTWSVAALRPWTLRASRSSSCISVMTVSLQFVMVIPSLSSRQDRVAPWATWTNSMPLVFHNCTDVHVREHRLILNAPPVALAMGSPRHRLLRWDTGTSTLSPSRGARGVGVHGAPQNCIQHVLRHNVLALSCARSLRR